MPETFYLFLSIDLCFNTRIIVRYFSRDNACCERKISYLLVFFIKQWFILLSGIRKSGPQNSSRNSEVCLPRLCLYNLEWWWILMLCVGLHICTCFVFWRKNCSVLKLPFHFSFMIFWYVIKTNVFLMDQTSPKHWECDRVLRENFFNQNTFINVLFSISLTSLSKTAHY